MLVNWGKCEGGGWCSFKGVDLSSNYFNNLSGVYIIWQGKGRVIRVGQGDIRDRLTKHREDSEINVYNNLFVTWAEVGNNFVDGVERYLGNVLSPKVGSIFPDTIPIKVNLPWSWDE